MNAFTLTPLQCACPTTRRLPLHHNCSIRQPRPSPNPPNSTRGPWPSRRRAAALPPPAPSSDDDNALITITYLGSRRLSGPVSHGRGDRCVDAVVRSPPPPFRNERKLRWNCPNCRKTTRCPRCRPHLLWPRASPPRGVPSCSSRPQRSSHPVPRRGSTTRRVPSPPSYLHCCPWRGCRDEDYRSSSYDAMPPHKSFLMKYASLSWGGGGGGHRHHEREM
jgi:hypothetical protein